MVVIFSYRPWEGRLYHCLLANEESKAFNGLLGPTSGQEHRQKLSGGSSSGPPLRVHPSPSLRAGLPDLRQMLELWAGNMAPKDILTLSQESAKETLQGEALVVVFGLFERTFPQRCLSPRSY